jgi:hypothetical protein
VRGGIPYLHCRHACGARPRFPARACSAGSADPNARADMITVATWFDACLVVFDLRLRDILNEVRCGGSGLTNDSSHRAQSILQLEVVQ